MKRKYTKIVDVVPLMSLYSNMEIYVEQL